jgi:hypothetical protein
MLAQRRAVGRAHVDLFSAPVMASKPVAKTMASSSCSAPEASRRPVAVISWIGSLRTSTSDTFGRL